MNTNMISYADYAPWKADLAAYRNLSDFDKTGFDLFLSWFEGWRIGKNLSPDRGAVVRFWNEQALSKPRKQWQLDQWLEAGRWYLNWLDVCKHHGRKPVSVPERLKMAVHTVGARRGLLPNSRKRYGGCLAQYGAWVKDARAAMSLDKGAEWLTYLVEVRGISYASQKVALNALVFFYKDVCGMEVEEIEIDVKLRKTIERVPVVMSRDEVGRVFAEMEGEHLLAAQLQYGAGLRVSELMRLRIKDFDWERNQLVVRSGKGDKDRVTMLPEGVKAELFARREVLRPLFDGDRLEGIAGVKMPFALDLKYPSAGQSWEWFWMFPSHKLSRDPDDGTERRHHVHAETYRRALRKAVVAAGIEKRVTPHVLRHVFSLCYTFQRMLYFRGNSRWRGLFRSSWRPCRTAAMAA